MPETFHRDGKPQLGLGKCQLRSSQGQTRYVYMVFLAYTLLMCELRQNRTLEWALRQVTEHGQTVDRFRLRLGIG